MAETNNSARFYIQKLNGENYQLWQHKVKMMFIKDKIWSVISDVEKKEGDAGYDAWKEKDNSALASINMLVEDSQLVHIMDAMTAKKAWDILKDYNQKSSLSSRVYLQKQLYNLHLSESGNMEEYITDFLKIVNKLSAVGKKFEDFDLACTLLCSLPESYSVLVTSLEGRSENEITLELVKGKLIGEYSNRKSKQELSKNTSEESALRVTGSCNQDFNRDECFWCRGRGHFKRECKDYQEWKIRNENRKERVNTATYTKSDDSDQYCFQVNTMENRDYRYINNKNAWVIDSGVSQHISNSKDFFHFYQEARGKVTVANNQKETVTGKGSGTLACVVEKNTRKIKVTDVLHVPSFSVNLLSVRVLDRKGFNVNFRGGYCMIEKNGKRIAVAKECNGIYILIDEPANTRMGHDTPPMGGTSVVEFPAYITTTTTESDSNEEDDHKYEEEEEDVGTNSIENAQVRRSKKTREKEGCMLRECNKYR